jgi:hypothetical protein
MSGASPMMEEAPMPGDPSARRPGEDWIAIVRKSGTAEFIAAFVANPVLRTSVLSGRRSHCDGSNLVGRHVRHPGFHA